MTNKNQSLSDSLRIFWADLPPTLVNDNQRALLKEKATFFPSILRLGIECRMKDNMQVDLQQCLWHDPTDIRYIREWLGNQRESGDPEMQLLLKFLNSWVSGYLKYQPIKEIFLEMDVLSGEDKVPLLFFSVDIEKERSDAFLLNILEETLGKNRTFYPVLERCFKVCPENASVFFVGIQFSRGVDAIRINIRNLYPDQVISFLKDVGYEYPTRNIEDWIDLVFSNSDRVRVCIDLGSSILPKIGFECFWDDQPSKDTRWRYVLDELVKRKVCLADKADALLAWEKVFFPDTKKHWPEHLWIESLQRKEYEFTYLTKKVSHLKLSLSPQKEPELKSYLAFGNLWLNMNTNQSQDLTNDLSQPKTLITALEDGLSFILNSQLQSGFWTDFQFRGKSDEWVTAYLSYYLSFFDAEIVKNSLDRAWKVLKKRYRKGDGWGYNILMPADADSTIWARLFSSRMNNTGKMEYDELNDKYNICGSGIRTFIENQDIRTYTKLDQNASFQGWQSLHLCVTAPYAVSGNSSALTALAENQNADGSLSAYWWSSDEYATALAAEAFSTDMLKYGRQIENAVSWARRRLVKILELPAPISFNVALLIRILLLSSEPGKVKNVIDNGLNYLLAAQNTDGSWPSSANLRVPMPGTLEPGKSNTNWTDFDQNRLFTSITVLTALRKLNGNFYGS